MIDQVASLLDQGKLAAVILKKYPAPHGVKTDKALYGFVMDLKNQFLRQSSPVSKIIYDDKLDVLHQALGLHSFVSRVQGGKLKAKHEIRIGSVFKTAPLAFLRVIAVHELAHLREKQHNKAFYQLCEYMEPNYPQLEFDMRLYLTYLECIGPVY
jgi:predicted metal-dependent hydrolase